MKKIYTWAAQPANRTLTVDDLKKAKGKKKFTQVTANTIDEAEAAEKAGFDMIICNAFNVKQVREGSKNLFLTAALVLNKFVTSEDIMRGAFEALENGADAVMIGSPIAKSSNAPGKGFHWGMATPSPVLPRGTRIEVGSTGSLERIIKGPALLDDGTHNLLGAIRTSMSTLGAKNIKEMQEVEIVIAPSLLTEGKVYQKAQQLGMGK